MRILGPLLVVYVARRGHAVAGLIILLAFVAVVIWLVVIWSRAKARADRAEAELAQLRSAYNQLAAGQSGTTARPSPMPPPPAATQWPSPPGP